MRTVSLGLTGVQVSSLCLGTMHLGSRDSADLSHRTLDQYVEAGGTFIDSANTYSFWIPGCRGGESELLLGKWMRDRGNRDRLFIATKVGFPYPGSEGGLRADVIRSECEKSLRRLRTDVIDLYYAHVDDRNARIEDTMEMFDKLIKQGKVRFVGASNFVSWRLEEARWVCRVNGWAGYCCLQQRHSYVRPNPGRRFDPQVVVTDEMLDYCRNRGMSLVAYSALLGGAYTRRDRVFPEQYLGPDTDGRLAVLNRVATELGATACQVVLAWMLHSQPAVIPIVAAGSVAQMTDNLGALEVMLTPLQSEMLTSALSGGKAW